MQEHCCSGNTGYEGFEVVNQSWEGLELDLGISCGKVLEEVDFGGIWPHALHSEHCTIEGNLRLPDPTLWTVEDDAMFYGCLHQLQEVSVMLLGGMAVDAYFTMNGDYAG